MLILLFIFFLFFDAKRDIEENVPFVVFSFFDISTAFDGFLSIFVLFAMICFAALGLGTTTEHLDLSP